MRASFAFLVGSSVALYGATMLVSASAAETVIRADTERNLRRSMVKVTRAVGSDRALELERILRSIVNTRVALQLLERSFILSDSSVPALVSGGFSHSIGAADRNVPRLITAEIGRLIDGRSIPQIMKLWADERRRFEATASAAKERMHLLESPLLFARAPAKRQMSEIPAGMLEVSAGLGTVSNGRGILIMTINNRHTQSIHSVVLGPQNDADHSCAHFEYSPAVPIRPAAVQRVIAATTSEHAMCASHLKLLGFRDGAGRHFGRVVKQPTDAEVYARFYRASLSPVGFAYPPAP